MKLSDKWNIPVDVMTRKVGDETVILNLSSGTYFGLDPVGTRIWQLFGECEQKSLVEIRDILVGEFDVTREQLESDLLRISAEFIANGLLEPIVGAE